MKINIGSTNEVKVRAVKELAVDYPLLVGAEICSCDVQSGVSHQPLSLDETMRGAMNRAKNSFAACDLSIGIESGFMAVPYSKMGCMHIHACAIFDGNDYYLGLSSAFDFPAHIAPTIISENFAINRALMNLKITDNPKLGAGQGAIGILTKGRITRCSHIKEAVRMALIHLENS